MPTMRPVLSMMAILFISGCVDPISLEPAKVEPAKPTPVIQQGVAPEPEPEPPKPSVEEKPPQPSSEEQAREKLKLGLDAWVFGDSFKKFGQDHPEISFFDTGWGFGEALLRYEIGHGRVEEFKRDDGSISISAEFVVTIVQSTRGGLEVKKNKNYIVASPQGSSGQWTITGYTP